MSYCLLQKVKDGVAVGESFQVYFCNMAGSIVLHCLVLFCTVLHCFALFCIVLHCFALFCIVLHCPQNDGFQAGDRPTIIIDIQNTKLVKSARVCPVKVQLPKACARAKFNKLSFFLSKKAYT